MLLDVPMTAAQPSEWTAITSLLLWVNAGWGARLRDAQFI
jgi:hypothetical protein